MKKIILSLILVFAIALPVSAETNRPVIEGNQKFVEVTNQALDLLQENDPPHYRMICENVIKIKGHTQDIILQNGGKPYAVQALNQINVYPFLINDKYRFNAFYMAGILTHEGAHAANDEFLPAYYDEENFIKQEKIAYAHGILSLELIGAPEWMIEEQIRFSKPYKNP